MKTTVDISDPLLRKARRAAARRGTTLRALVEQGLRHVLSDKERAPFKLRHVSFGSGGMRPEFAEASWQEILDASYEERGGDRA